MALYPEDALKRDLAASIEHFKQSLKQLHVGRARADMFEDIIVKAYGVEGALKNYANINIESALCVAIQPWDKNIVDDVLKAIQEANLGYNPVSDGTKVRINIPPLTEETRKNTVKELGLMHEEAKVRVRQIRHNFIEIVDKLEGISEDEQERAREAIQKEIDDANNTLQELAENKEEELMSI